MAALFGVALARSTRLALRFAWETAGEQLLVGAVTDPSSSADGFRRGEASGPLADVAFRPEAAKSCESSAGLAELFGRSLGRAGIAKKGARSDARRLHVRLRMVTVSDQTELAV